MYVTAADDPLEPKVNGCVLGEWERFNADPDNYQGSVSPDCMAVPFDRLWLAHSSNRLDPKYHLFEREAARPTPKGWVTLPLSKVMSRRLEEIDPERDADTEFKVMTIAQTGEIRERVAGKGEKSAALDRSLLRRQPGYLVRRTNRRHRVFVDRPLEGMHGICLH